MDSKLFRIGGTSAVVYAVVAAASAIYLTYVAGPPTVGAEEALQNLAGVGQTYNWINWLSTLSWLLVIPMALALYFGLRNREPSYAVLGLAALLFMALAVMIPSTGNAVALWKLSQVYATGSPAEKAAALLIAEAVARWGLLVIPGFVAGSVGIGLFGLAMRTSPSFPHWLGWVGIVGGVLGLVGQLHGLTEALGVVTLASWVVMLGWVFLSGIYLLRLKSA